MSKRSSSAEVDVAGKKSRLDEKDASEVRFLIDANQVGAVIGQGGANEKRIRSEFNTTLQISKVESKLAVAERVMAIRGSLPSICEAIQFIAHLLLEATVSRSRKRSEAELPPSTVTLRLLVHKLAVGVILGKGGATIKETQAQTGTTMQISKEPLPGSTEKSVSFTGAPENIKAAIALTLTQLSSHPLRGNVESYPYIPGSMPPAAAAVYPPSPYGVPFAGVGVGGPFGVAGYPSAFSFGIPPSAGSSSSATSQKIAIPTSCVGCVIGKGGMIIRDLRAQSGTQINISPVEPTNPGERVVTVTGTPEGIQTAVSLIRQLVEQQPAGAQDY